MFVTCSLKHRACLPGKNQLKGVSQSSDNCCWPELDHSCSVLADKHKLERFLRPDAAVVVTVYAPITFPPASVLLFKQRSNGKLVNAEEVLKKASPSCCLRRWMCSHPCYLWHLFLSSLWGCSGPGYIWVVMGEEMMGRHLL